MRRLACLGLLLCNYLLVTAQQVETVFVPGANVRVHTPYLRFDPFTIDHPTFKKAYSKELRVKDQRGYLWFLADSQTLIRYDGTYTRVFDDRAYYGVEMTPTGVIWSACADGMLLFDEATETFRPVATPLVKNYSIWGQAATPGGTLYVLFPATTNNVRCPFFAFDTRRGRFRHIKLPRITNGYTGQLESASDSVLLKPLAVDAQGRVWGQVNYRTYNQPGYYDPATNRLVWFPIKGMHCPDLRGDTRIYQNIDLAWIIPDRNFLWMGGWYHTGVLRFDIETLRWKQYYLPTMNANRILQAQPAGLNRLMLHSDGPPAFFDASTETLNTYPHLPDNHFSPPTTPNCVFKTGENEFWLGKQGANGDPTVYFLNPTSTGFRMLPVELQRPKTKVLGRHRGRLFFYYKTDAALILSNYDEATRQVTQLLRQPLNDVDQQGFNAMLPDSINRTLWLVGKTEQGCIWQWYEQTNSVSCVRLPIQNLPLRTDQVNDIWSIAQDRTGIVWIPVFRLSKSQPGVALIRYDGRQKQFTSVQLSETARLPGAERYRSILTDSRGIIWIGTNDDTRIRWYNPQTRRLTFQDAISKSTHFTNQAISKMVEDQKRGVVWIAAGSLGLWTYTFRTNRWERVKIDLRGGVINILLLRDGTLWLKGFNSLIRYHPETGRVKQLDVDYGIENFSFGSFIKAPDDELFFDKFRFYSNEISEDTLKPKAVFSFVRVFDQTLPNVPNLNHTNRLTLQYNQNFFTVGFSILAYVQREKNQYAYKLEGFNTNWVLAGNRPLATFTNVPPGRYTLLVKGANMDGIWSYVRRLTIVVVPPFWQTWWFIGLMIVLASATLYALYRYRLAQQMLKSRLKAEEALRKQREAEYQQRIAQTEIAALRAQMNPHFIFNCLNAIQYFTVNNEAEAASSYLTKFSRLIRLVLENSRSEKVTLANELETLRLYIELEAMRFGSKLNYAIQVDPRVDQDGIEIPPLLIQPFVENAIWHGLMHKRSGGQVTVRVETGRPLPQDFAAVADQSLRVIITDDGIGRARAAEIKSKSVTQHKSFGMNVTAERIAQINQLYQSQTTIQIHDLTDASGQPTGTQVIVQISI